MSRTVTFVVIAHDEERGIERTLRSILAQEAAGATLDVVVVDDASRDRTAELVAALAASEPRLRLVRLATNLGRGGARARGVAEATGELVASVDADIVLPLDWLERCLAALDAGADVVGGTAVPDGDVAYLHRRFALVPRVAPHTIPVSASNAVLRRAALAACGFDGSLREGEDVALVHALTAAGFRVRGIEGLVVQHEEWKTFRQSVRWLYASGKGATRQLVRYRELRRPDVAAALGWGAIGVAAAGAARGRPAALGLPAAYLAALATAHLRGKFELAEAPPASAAGAVATDVVLLGAYVVGRAAGIPAALAAPRPTEPGGAA